MLRFIFGSTDKRSNSPSYHFCNKQHQSSHRIPRQPFHRRLRHHQHLIKRHLAWLIPRFYQYRDEFQLRREIDDEVSRAQHDHELRSANALHAHSRARRAGRFGSYATGWYCSAWGLSVCNCYDGGFSASSSTAAEIKHIHVILTVFFPLLILDQVECLGDSICLISLMKRSSSSGAIYSYRLSL